VYVPVRRWWEELKGEMCEEDAGLFSAFRERLEGEVVVVAASGSGVGTALIRKELASRRLVNWWSITPEGDVLCPAGSFELDIFVPRCRCVVFVGSGKLKAEGLESDLALFTTRLFLLFSAQRINGNLLSYGAQPFEIRDVTGDVILCYPFSGPMRMEEGLVYRNKEAARAVVAGVGGSLKIRCEMLNLRLEGVRGRVDVFNRFGDTEAYVPSCGEGINLESVSGGIRVYLPRDFKGDVAAWTRCGCIDYGGYKRGLFDYKSLKELYIGTLPYPRADEARLKIKTGSGGITLKAVENG
ncbi:hypothetical protein DRP77_13475, partial [Candidatus Poribacteria bacterium]